MSTAQSVRGLIALVIIAAFVAAYFISPLAYALNTHSADFESGSSQSFSISDASQTGLDLTNTLTIETWVKFESLPGADQVTFVSKREASGNQRSYFFAFDSSNALRFVSWTNGAAAGVDVSVAWTPSTGTWYHVAVTKTGTAVKFYVNGSQQGSTQNGSNGTIYSGSAPVAIGADVADGNANPIDAKLDDVRIWDVVRSDSEIANGYQRELSVGDTSGLKAYWKFDNNPNDETTNNNDLINNNSTQYSEDVAFTGGNTHAYDFEKNSSQTLSISDANQTGLDLTDALTIETWVKFETLPAEDQVTFVSKREATGNQRSYFFAFDSSNALRFVNWTNGSAAGSDVSVSWTPATSTWYHVAVTKTGTTIKFYVNGSQQGSTQAGSNGTIFSGSAPVSIGGDVADGNANLIDAKLDEVRIWNVARTGTDIANGYLRELGVADTSGLQAYWRLNNNSINDETPNNNDLTNNNGATSTTDVPFN